MAVKTVKFSKTLVRKWVKALESGKYRQGRKRLRKTSRGKNYFCCLGVACDVAGFDYIGGGTLLSSRPDRAHYNDLATRLGIGKEAESNLVFMNDGYGLPSLIGHRQPVGFKEIAKWIRENILKEKTA